MYLSLKIQFYYQSLVGSSSPADYYQNYHRFFSRTRANATNCLIYGFISAQRQLYLLIFPAILIPTSNKALDGDNSCQEKSNGLCNMCRKISMKPHKVWHYRNNIHIYQVESCHLCFILRKQTLTPCLRIC